MLYILYHKKEYFIINVIDIFMTINIFMTDNKLYEYRKCVYGYKNFFKPLNKSNYQNRKSSS